MFKKKYQQFSRQRGVLLLLAMLILSLVLGAALGTSTILLQETKMTRDIGNSVLALYAAETGIEQVLITKARPVTSCDNEASPCDLGNGASFYLSILISGESGCPSDFDYCIKSIGIFKETRRGLEVDY